MAIVTGALAAILAMLAAPASRVDEPTYLGLLEPPVVENPSTAPRVRVLFVRASGRWQAMPHRAGNLEALAEMSSAYPDAVAWTVSLAGREVGRVRSARPAKTPGYSDIGTQIFLPAATFPRIRKGAERFETWQGRPAFRPLVVVSRPQYSDPDGWKAFPPSQAQLRRATAEFRRAVALELKCGAVFSRGYSEAYVQSTGIAYRSSRGDVLIALRADPARNQCGPNDGVWQSAWFLLRADATSFVGEQMALLDAGDYDADGVSEVLLKTSGYNRDGYLLLNPRDASTVEFSWSYH